MKRTVNGAEHELSRNPDVLVTQGQDRLFVKSPTGTGSALVARSGNKTHVSFRGRTYVVEKAARKRLGVETSDGEIRAPMPGQVVEICCADADEVETGTRLIVIEAMKMQLPIVSPSRGKVTSLSVRAGEQVAEGQFLLKVEPAL